MALRADVYGSGTVAMPRQKLVDQLRQFHVELDRVGSNDNLQLILDAADLIEQDRLDDAVASAMLKHSFVAQRNKNYEYAAALSEAAEALR
ncbi:hypothetical protein [Methylobacterium gnaphalii]|nr:hypothetical protein [Methylobacterium gnaphalii]